MLPFFVIGLREGLEASLIVGIVATFLVQQGRHDMLRWVWIGVGAAVTLCAAVAVALEIASRELPQKEQEALETVIGLVAVGMVTWMIIWMTRHARGLKQHLEEDAAAALAAGSAGTLVVMAFLAVLREGFETAVFLLAAFNAERNAAAAAWGAVLGVGVAVVLGYGIYRGGVRLNLERFFKITGVVLVLVAAGLLALAVHTGHEAGWINFGQSAAFDLAWLVDPGSIRSALLTGMFGIQPQPVAIEVIVWVAYAVPMTMYVLWPRGRGRAKGAPVKGTEKEADRRTTATLATGATVAALAAMLVLAGCGSNGSSVDKDTKGVTTVEVTLTDKGCDPQNYKLPAGPTVFEVRNDNSDAVTEFEILRGDTIVAEVENIAPGFNRELGITLKEGTFTTWCKNGTVDDGKGKMVVTPATDPTPAAKEKQGEADAAVATYRTFLESQTAEFVTRTEAFAEAVKSGDVEKAKGLYAQARAPFEAIEPVAESFGDLDPRIDAREGDVPAEEWGGYHRIERALWVDNSTEGMGPVADQLVADVTKLQTLVQTVELEPATIANGALALLDEVSTSKVTGEEERYSRTDLDDIQANINGAKAAFDAVAGLLPANADTTRAAIDQRFEVLQTALDSYKTPTGFVRYTELTEAQTQALAQAVDALAEPLSRIPKQIVSRGS